MVNELNFKKHLWVWLFVFNIKTGSNKALFKGTNINMIPYTPIKTTSSFWINESNFTVYREPHKHKTKQREIKLLFCLINNFLEDNIIIFRGLFRSSPTAVRHENNKEKKTIRNKKVSKDF